MKETELLCLPEDIREIIWHEIECLPFAMGELLRTVELFLPKELIFMDADQWTASEQNFSRMGEEYRVVVRLLNRFTNRSKSKYALYQRKWKEKWHAFRNKHLDVFCWHDHHHYKSK